MRAVAARGQSILSEIEAPKLPPYVLSLVVVAMGGESKPVRERLFVAHNAALRYALEYAGQLPSVGDPRTDTTVQEWLDTEQVPQDLFEFCARLLDGIDVRVRARHSRLKPSKGDEPTTFDRSALLALAQVIHQRGGMRRGVSPGVAAAFKAIRAASARQLQEHLVENYLGNVLHDYFDSCEVRAEFPRLPVTTEHELRIEHGRSIARQVFAALPAGNRELPPHTIQLALQQVLGMIWLAERSLDD